MIEVQNLVKWFGPTLAVADLSFNIPEGKVIGFLGPNGAGKTTTLRMITGFIPPTSGRAIVAGHDVFTDSAQARANIGYLPESTPLYPEMRVEEYLHYRGKLVLMDRSTRNRRIGTVCEQCGLTQVRRRLIGQLSKGNRQRVGLAQALLHEPKVIILDEPTSGLDPNQVTHVRELVRELRSLHTIVLSTHILPEVERIADHVLIIAGGRIVAEGTPDELRRDVSRGARVLVEVKAHAQAVQKTVSQLPQVESVETTMQGEWCHAVVYPRNTHDPREPLGQLLSNNQWPIRELKHDTASLEQFFVQITAEQKQAHSEIAA